MLFTLLVTNYNHATYLEELITSIVLQSYKNWEIIFVDDASTDNSLQVLQNLSDKYRLERQLKIIRKEKNEGYGAALSTAAENGIGDFFCIVDGDDVLEINALQQIAEFLAAAPECKFLYSQYRVIDANSKIIKETGTCKLLPRAHTALSYYLATERAVISHIKVFASDIYKKTVGFDSSIKKAVDQDIVFKIEELARPYFLNKKLYRYRVHDDQITKRKIGALSGRQWHDKVARDALERRCNKRSI